MSAWRVSTDISGEGGAVQPSPSIAAVEAILQDHAHLGTVMVSLQQWLARAASDHLAPDFGFFAAALYYINDFPERYHHPKEDEHLFRAIRLRTAALDTVLDELQSEHVGSASMVAAMEHALVLYQGGAAGGLAQFKGAVDGYAAMLRAHMRKEEELIAEAARFLQAADWRDIAAAFTAHDDPLFGANPRQEFAHLYSRIVNALPAKLRRSKAD